VSDAKPVDQNDPIEAFMRCMEEGTFSEVYIPICHPDHVVNLSGTSYVSGQFMGRDAYYNHTSQIVPASFATDGPGLGGHRYLKRRRMACKDHNATVWLVEGDIPTKAGVTDGARGKYEQRYAFISRASGGLIEFTYEMVDTDMLDTAALGNRHRIVREIPKSPFGVDLVGRSDNPGGSRARSIAVMEMWLDAVYRNDRSAYIALHDPKLVANIVGRTPYSGRWHGRDEYLNLQFDFHADLFEPESRQIARFYRMACADENGFCVLFKGKARTREGSSYEQSYCLVAQLLGDRITESFIWLDTAHAEEVIFDNPFVHPRKPSPAQPFSIY